MTRELTGPRLAPKTGSVRNLVVLLHGYGANGDDLIDLGRYWSDMLPDTAFVAPNAPDPCPGTSVGRQWFPLSGTSSEQERWQGVEAAQPCLEAFLDEERNRYALEDGQVALCGFSQGAMMTLHVGLRRPRALAALIGFSGLLVGAEHLKTCVQRPVPPILLVHGDKDPVIPVEAMFIAADQLTSADIAVQWHLSPGIGHSIDAEGLRQAGLFLSQALRQSDTKRQ